MCRGYYTRSYLWAVDFDGKELKTKWLHASLTPNDWKVTDADGKVLKELMDVRIRLMPGCSQSGCGRCGRRRM